ncbi:DUF1415 domain-containing protein [Gilvimarinus agarilyticus]|uniref:DUF1415 domain-containing protein n=1 Tax=unclassified Gilvimarinus TaxID=2642066 RepID=UPI001C09BEB5|nr:MULTISPECIES: DUF1415 domain-containing protein [unclassified Gilvimarinus]MBU2887531.1 DUF1415 domain-containing protein [Gilvimarinus agarilyticus]MDO6572182.1 DUF1415 domain-containing protein [Gilvimarinus sp. 2_MG-2023]MDO6746746.1 DUF1415 domain-containing protein [Gilvimarinus sp. 1_MG-2023]
MNKLATSSVIAETKQWFETVVLGLNLCPFAHQPAKHQRIRFAVFDETDEFGLFEVLGAEVARLDEADISTLETTLLILPEGYEDFYFYTITVQQAESWLNKQGLLGRYQIAHFHPDYQFSNTDYDERSNLTNRSPYPILHLLREQSLTNAIDNGADTESVPERNIERMQSLTEQEVATLFSYLNR